MKVTTSNNLTIILDTFEIQKDLKNNHFRQVGCSKVPYTEMYVNGAYISQWQYIFLFIESKKYLNLIIDQNNKVVKIWQS